MTTAVRNLLHSFDALPDPEKRELAVEILRRCHRFQFPPLTDEDLVRSAEELFLELDRREEEDAGSVLV